VKLGRTFSAIIMLALLAGCGQVHEATERARAENVAREAAIRRITVSSESVIPEHPYFERLGTVGGGQCTVDRNSEEHVPFADFLRRNAYLKFGDSADAIVEARAWYIPQTMLSPVGDVSGSSGEFYCCGVAVHFVDQRQ
jgi:hypothetical protein